MVQVNVFERKGLHEAHLGVKLGGGVEKQYLDGHTFT